LLSKLYPSVTFSVPSLLVHLVHGLFAEGDVVFPLGGHTNPKLSNPRFPIQANTFGNKTPRLAHTSGLVAHLHLKIM